jgi:two-component system heavy metal sensor histidine kinase CusS
MLFRSSNLGSKIIPDLTPAKLDRASVLLGDLGLLRVNEFRTGTLHVEIASSLNYLSTVSRRFNKSILLALPAVFLVSLAVGYLLCQITLRPLRLIEQTARRISFSNLSERIPIPAGKDEVAGLANLLNEMFERLERSFQRVKEFTADFSHELRTPLSIVALHTEKVLKKPDLDPESAAALREVLSETNRLNHIIDQILIVAKAEAQALPLKMAFHPTSRFIEEFGEDAAALAEAAGKRFKLGKNEAIITLFDSSWIRQVLFNLLSNAIKFSPDKGLIELDSSRDGKYWRITVRDEGPGVAPEHAENIFQRFTQIKGSSDAPPGSGLGLAVSKSIVELHKGHIYCEPGPRVGTRWVVCLPIQNGVTPLE